MNDLIQFLFSPGWSDISKVLFGVVILIAVLLVITIIATIIVSIKVLVNDILLKGDKRHGI